MNPQACGQSQRRLLVPEPLTVSKVFNNLKLLASEKGSGSVARRKQIITGMLRACRNSEICILVRTLIQNLRIGASWLTVVGALGKASAVHGKGISISKAELEEAASSVCEAYHMCPCFDVLVPALIAGGIEEAKRRQACPISAPSVAQFVFLHKIFEREYVSLNLCTGRGEEEETKQLHLPNSTVLQTKLVSLVNSRSVSFFLF